MSEVVSGLSAKALGHCSHGTDSVTETKIPEIRRFRGFDIETLKEKLGNYLLEN